MCGKRKSLPMVHPPIPMHHQPVEGACPVMLLDQDLCPDQTLDLVKLTAGPMTLWQMPVPAGYSPVLLTLAPEDVATLMRPSAADTLCCILGSLLPALVGVSDCQELYRSRVYPVDGKSRSSTATKGSTPQS